MVEVANLLNLSVRTIEFYIKNIKAKLQCQTRTQLIRLVLSSDFLIEHVALIGDKMCAA